MKEYGLTILKGVGESKVIWMFSIIGEIEGHESAQQQTKTTQYEHVLPLLTKAENQEEVEGILFLINTVGGDVSCGLAMADFIASLSKPTIALVIGDIRSDYRFR